MVLEADLQDAVQEFVERLLELPSVLVYLGVQKDFDTDPQLSQVRREFTIRAKAYRAKEAENTLTSSDIDEIRAMQESVNNHPVSLELARSRSAVTRDLQRYNRIIAEVTGVDFAATAAPSGCCG